jgi:predicted ATPase/class 3 adenylate cyclase
MDSENAKARFSRVRDLPEGIVTFLFTDVEASTRLARTLGDDSWAQQLETHRRLVRDSLEPSGGQEVDAQGDALFAVFRRPSDALSAAVACQRALTAHEWPEGAPVRIRVGLHTGEAVLRGGHYMGQEVHRASRICDVAHGGQIVASQATAELVRESLPAQLSLRDLGAHRLKDLEEPQRLYQVAAPDLRSDFPALRSRVVALKLPAERSSFVGRVGEIEALRSALDSHRLLTLTGIGGSGKTRLALRVASLAGVRFPDGAAFVDLATVSDPDLVPQTFASVAGISLVEGPGTAGESGSEDRLVEALSRRECLLVVDNCEHLIDAVADLLDRILEACPGVTVLATSREALGVEGEQVTRVPSLSLPDDPADAERSEAVALFVQRARAVKPGFALGPENRDPVVEICRHLDGIPLAIEFAGARVAHLAPRQIADRLQDRFRLLTGGRRRIQRQQTLAAALDWSHDLLTEPEQVLFRRLAVFAGSFGIDAAEAICSGDGAPASSVLDTLASLVAKSLVGSEADGAGDTRYRLLESVRMYASEKLTGADEADVVRAHHRDWYLSWLEAIPLEQLTFAPDGLAATTSELENLRAAADWCHAEDRPDLLERIVFPFHFFWSQSGAHEEGLRRVREVLRDETRLTPEQAADAHALLGSLENLQLENQGALEHADRTIALAAGKARPSLTMALSLRGFSSSVSAAFPGADPRHAEDSRRDAEQAITVAEQGLAIEWRGWAEYWRAMSEMNIGDFEQAAHWYAALDETVNAARYRQWLRTGAPAGLAVAHHLLGQADAALQAATHLCAMEDSMLEALRWQSVSLLDATPALVAAGEVAEAHRILRQDAELQRRSGVPLSANHVFCMSAVLAYLEGHLERAGRLMAATRYLGGAAEKSIPFRTPASMSLYRHYLPRVREALGPERAHRVREAGRAMSLDEAWREALD